MKILRELDTRLERETVRGPASMSPSRPRATSLEALAADKPQDRQAQHWGESLAAVVGAQLDAFPESLFWDFDAMSSALWSLARRSPQELDRRVEAIVGVQALYGASTDIRFRYTHDFNYGFDWAKWIGRGGGERAQEPPFGERFVAAMVQRAHELTDLIAQDDAKYPKLSGPGHRNPYSFARDPDSEWRLHRSLAERGEVPLAAWDGAAAPVLARERDFLGIRQARAEQLGLAQS